MLCLRSVDATITAVVVSSVSAACVSDHVAGSASARRRPDRSQSARHSTADGCVRPSTAMPDETRRQLVSAGSQTDRSPPSARDRLAAAAGPSDDAPADQLPLPGSSPSGRRRRLSTDSGSPTSGVGEATAEETAPRQQRLVHLLTGWVPQRSAEKSTQTRRDPLQTDAERLALDVVYYVLGRQTEPARDQVARTLRLATDEILSKHRILLNGMVGRLQIQPDTCYETFVSVADELFEGGNVSWARIITLYAFGARLALYCQEKDMADFVPEITRFLGAYATEHLSEFVRQQGGWPVMCEHFQYPENMEGKVWKALLKLGIGLGIAATATLITSSSR